MQALHLRHSAAAAALHRAAVSTLWQPSGPRWRPPLRQARRCGRTLRGISRAWQPCTRWPQHQHEHRHHYHLTVAAPRVCKRLQHCSAPQRGTAFLMRPRMQATGMQASPLRPRLPVRLSPRRPLKPSCAATWPALSRRCCPLPTPAGATSTRRHCPQPLQLQALRRLARHLQCPLAEVAGPPVQVHAQAAEAAVQRHPLAAAALQRAAAVVEVFPVMWRAPRRSSLLTSSMMLSAHCRLTQCPRCRRSCPGSRRRWRCCPPLHSPAALASSPAAAAA